MNFIVGSLHGGTSLPADLLNSDKRIFYLGERYDILEKVDEYKKIVRETSKIVIDKVLIHEFPLGLWEAKEIYSPSKILFVVRDSRDVAVSQHGRGGRELQWISWQWNLLVDHYFDIKKKFPDDIELMKYEDLINDTEETLGDICRFFGIQFSMDLIKYLKMTPETAYNNITYGSKIVKNRIGVYNSYEHQDVINGVAFRTSLNLKRMGYIE